MAFLAALVFAALLFPGGAEFAVSITSDPSTGPFLRGTGVTFHCSVDPLPPEPVTYHWRSADPFIGYTSSQNRSLYVGIRRQHFSWLFCEVLTNGSSVGNTSTFIELQGFIFTQDPQARSFTVGDAISLRVNVSTYYYGRYIRNLTWYHNGTEVERGGRVTVNHTNLTIHSAIPADAGVYQVKITSIDHYGYHNDTCDSLWLPIIENVAGFAPTTFMLSECTGGRIQYDTEIAGGVGSHYIMNDGVEPQIAMNIDTSLVKDPFLAYSNISWFHNGAPVDADRVVGTASYQPGSINVTLTVHNATAEDTGVYEGTAVTHSYAVYTNSNRTCSDYYEYIDYYIWIPFLQTVYLSIIVDLYEPTTVRVSAGSPSLLARETTLLTCWAEGGNPSTHTLTWSKDSEVLATGTNTLSVTSLANSFGEYVCSVQTVVGPANNKVTDHMELLLKEKSPMQLQIASSGQCAVWKESTAMSDVILAVQDVMHGRCNCSADLQNVTLTCSASGSSVIISANLSYSDSRGELTASNLVASLQTWLLTASQPAITIAGESYSLSRTCPADSNQEAFDACINELTPPASSTIGAQAGLFMGGLCAGLTLAIVAFGIVICVFLKVRQNTDMAGSQTENKEVKVSENSAYEMTRYQTRETMVATEEPVYEVPA